MFTTAGLFLALDRNELDTLFMWWQSILWTSRSQSYTTMRIKASFLSSSKKDRDGSHTDTTPRHTNNGLTCHKVFLAAYLNVGFLFGRLVGFSLGCWRGRRANGWFVGF